MNFHIYATTYVINYTYSKSLRQSESKVLRAAFYNGYSKLDKVKKNLTK